MALVRERTIHYKVGDVVQRISGGNGSNTQTTFRIEEGDEAIVCEINDANSVTVMDKKGRKSRGNAYRNLVYVRASIPEWD